MRYRNNKRVSDEKFAKWEEYYKSLAVNKPTKKTNKIQRKVKNYATK